MIFERNSITHECASFYKIPEVEVSFVFLSNIKKVRIAKEWRVRGDEDGTRGSKRGVRGQISRVL